MRQTRPHLADFANVLAGPQQALGPRGPVRIAEVVDELVRRGVSMEKHDGPAGNWLSVIQDR
ncbi:MAG TPA: hypothetical protein VIR00_04620 [Micromonosporaceae bacterium]